MLRRIGTLAAGAFVAASCAGQPPPPSTSRPSVLLVTIDTLRADRVGGALTPAIDALAAQGITFTAMRATVPLTLPSHTTILTGMLPPEHGVRQNGAVRDPAQSTPLARVFRDAGYQTAAFVGAYVLDRRFGLAEGFDEYDDRIARDPRGPTRLESERRADEVESAVRAWLTKVDPRRPAFVWIHFYDPHAPYDPPPEFLKTAGGRPYEGEIAFVDAQLPNLLREARHVLGENLIVAIAGDHGEGLGEHGEATHGMLAYDSTLRVPFVLAGPAIEQGRRSGVLASLRDVAPTLLAAARFSAPPTMTGRDLLGRATSADVYAETTYPDTAGWSPLRVLVDERWKLVASSTRELYDTLKDPGERQDLSRANPTVASAMADRADRIFAQGKTASAAVSAEAADRLRALGYVTPSPTTPATGSHRPNPRDRIDQWNQFEEALSRMAAGRSSDAVASLAALAATDPDARVFGATYAQALKDTGRTREALGIYRTLVSRWTQDATLFHGLAVAARDLGYAREALRAERAALTVDPQDANAQNGLGLLHADAGRPREAAEAFARATELDPNNASFWTNLGNARRALGELADAERSYHRALTLSPQYADALNGLGTVLVQEHRAPEAIAWFQKGITADPRFVEAQLNLGIAYQESGDRRRAAEQYRKVIAMTPGGSRERQAARALLNGLR